MAGGAEAEDAGRRGKPPGAYHHGSLRRALLEAAEAILERDGVHGLTLRAAARDAGVSHAAPKNHFGDLSGLLSELAASGFERLREELLARARPGQTAAERKAAIGYGYVAFARAHPGLFQLMFRSERLDPRRPSLADAMQGAFQVLAGTAGVPAAPAAAASPAQVADIAAAWSIVHGFAMLMLDGRLKPLLARLPPGGDEMDLLRAVLDRAR
ncbi:TetR/AcrR family transcriptional regulator [Stella sp.]|uniref:TetR/AcrR family transcriptional regulator n=1 Tax=Stella sp. TaxID=2912054 RepID=UPI0035ADBDFD